MNSCWVLLPYGIRVFTTLFHVCTSGCFTFCGSFRGLCTCRQSQNFLLNLWNALDKQGFWRFAGRGSFSFSSRFPRLRNITQCRAIRPWLFCLAPQWQQEASGSIEDHAFWEQSSLSLL